MFKRASLIEKTVKSLKPSFEIKKRNAIKIVFNGQYGKRYVYDTMFFSSKNQSDTVPEKLILKRDGES